jgi:hypothetical protein
VREIGGIAGDQCPSTGLRRGCQQTVDHRQRVGDGQPTPFLGNSRVHVDDVIPVGACVTARCRLRHRPVTPDSVVIGVSSQVVTREAAPAGLLDLAGHRADAQELFGIGPVLRYIVATSDASRSDGPVSSLRRVFGSILPGTIRVRM